MQFSEFGIQNSELWSSMEMKSEPLGHRNIGVHLKKVNILCVSLIIFKLEQFG